MYYYYILYHINYPFGNFPTEPVTDQGQPVNLKSGQSQKGRLNRPVLIVKLITKKTASTVYIYIYNVIYTVYMIYYCTYIYIYIYTTLLTSKNKHVCCSMLAITVLVCDIDFKDSHVQCG